MKTVLRIPSTLHSKFASIWLGLAIGSRTDLHSVRIRQYVKQVQYVEPQEDCIAVALLSSLSFNFRCRCFGYIGVS